MSNRPTGPAEARAAEAAAIRRRWITLGEILAVLAVIISGTTLWLNWSARSDEAAGKAAESAQASTRAATLVLHAEAQSKGKRLLLAPASTDQSVQSQTIRFPADLGLSPIETTGEPRIESGWFDNALKKVRDRAGMPDNSRGDDRLPVLIETSFLADGKPHSDLAIYDLGYTIEGRMLSGHDVTLRGLSLVKRVKSGDAEAALDKRWANIVPVKK